MTEPSTTTPDQVRELKVLVTAASMHGATAEIAEAIGQELSEQGLEVTVAPPEQVESVDGYSAVVIGSAVYTGHWLDPAKDLVSRCHDDLVHRPVWLFSSGPVGKPSGRMAQAMGRDPADLGALRADSHARGHRMFGGKLDKTALTGPQRAALLVFRGMEGDFRDWTEIRRWADDIAGELATAAQ